MAMKMKTLISCILLLVSVWTRLQLLVVDCVDASIVWIGSRVLNGCENTKYIEGSDFENNVNLVLESLVWNSSTSGFIKRVEGQDSDSTVYGFFQCRGDLSSYHCEQCASTANVMLLMQCNRTSGFVVQRDECFLRYDNHNFYNVYNESSEFLKLCNSITSDQPDQFRNTTRGVLSEIIEKAVRSPELFATYKNETGNVNVPEIYSLAQCWGNLSQTNCRSCLAAARSNITGSGLSSISSAGCQTGALGGLYLSPNCVLHYESYLFFNTSIILPPTPPPSPSPSPPPPPPPPIESPGLSGGKRNKVLGMTLGVLAATIGLIAAICLWKCIFFSRRKPWERISGTRGKGEINLSPSIANPELIFKYDILRKAASNFKEENKLGEGGFGSVFKGVLPDAREVAIKRLNINSRQGDTEFLSEANLISQVQHRNLVKLIGCSVKNSERLLVYEYAQNSSLDKILFDTTKRHLLDWRDRYDIILGTARGLAYLHEESAIRIIHRDIKASNILLDDKYKPKIADFGLAKLFAEDQSHISTRIAGTLGYMAPEYALRGQLTEKADVFSFGILVLEIISGRKNQSSPQHMEFLFEATWRLYNAERALEVMDPTLEGSYSWEEGIRVIKIGLLCTQASATLRPSMSRVVSMLTSEREYIYSPTRPASIDLDSVAAAQQLQRPRVIDPHKTSSSTASSSTAPSDIHSAAANPSSGTLEPR